MFPVLTIDLETPPVGWGVLGAEAGFWFMMMFLGITCIFTVVLAPLGFLIV
jgi:hypothetical protein